MTVPASELGDNYLLTSQIAGTKGNPKLKNQGENTMAINYTIVPSNIFNLSAFFNYQFLWRLMAIVYEPIELDGHEYMLSTTINNGHTNNLDYGIAVGLKPFKALSLRASLNAKTSMIRSLTRYNGTELSYNFQASYIFSKFYISAYYFSHNKQVHHNYTIKTPQSYGFELEWSNGDLNVSATARNPFTSSYKQIEIWLDRENYRVYRTDYSDLYHRRFIISMTYSFGYGKKKVTRDNETKAPSSIESAILK